MLRPRSCPEVADDAIENAHLDTDKVEANTTECAVRQGSLVLVPAVEDSAVFLILCLYSSLLNYDVYYTYARVSHERCV